jgi:hypothetical protein
MWWNTGEKRELISTFFRVNSVYNQCKLSLHTPQIQHSAFSTFRKLSNPQSAHRYSASPHIHVKSAYSYKPNHTNLSEELNLTVFNRMSYFYLYRVALKAPHSSPTPPPLTECFRTRRPIAQMANKPCSFERGTLAYH